MKWETITVYSSNGMEVSILKEIADELNIKHNMRVSDALLNHLCIKNAEEGIARCKLELSMRETFDYEDKHTTTDR